MTVPKANVCVFLLVFSFFLPKDVISQGFDISVDTLERIYLLSDSYTSDTVFITNTSGSSVEYSYRLLVNTMTNTPNNWLGYICTHRFCLPSIPDSGILGILDNSEKGYLNLHMNSFNNKTGEGVISYEVYETLTPLNLDTVTFSYKVKETVGLKSINNFHQVNIFPNPANDYFSISGMEGFQNSKITIYSINGKLIDVVKGFSYPYLIPIEGLSKGIYWIRIEEGNHETQFTKLIKY